MDPQKLSQIDPKLKEVYDKVMGAKVTDQTPAQTAPPGVSSQAPQPDIQSNLKPAENPQPEANPKTQFVQVPQDNPSIIQPISAVSSDPTQLNSEIAASGFSFIPNQQASTTEALTLKGKGVPGKFVIFGIITLVFIVIYALFWSRVISLNLPFLR